MRRGFALLDGRLEANQVFLQGAFRTVNVVSRFRGRKFEIELEGDVVTALRKRARRKGVPVGRLASSILRRQLVSGQ